MFRVISDHPGRALDAELAQLVLVFAERLVELSDDLLRTRGELLVELAQHNLWNEQLERSFRQGVVQH